MDRVVGRRERPRLRLAVDGRLITLGGNEPIELTDLSVTGAKVRWNSGLPPGRCVLKWLKYEAWAETVWVRAGFAGLRVLLDDLCLTRLPCAY